MKLTFCLLHGTDAFAQSRKTELIEEYLIYFQHGCFADNNGKPHQWFVVLLKTATL